MHSTTDLVELSLYRSNKFSAKQLLAPKKVQELAHSLPCSEQVRLQNYLSSTISRAKRRHELSLDKYQLSFSMNTSSTSKEVVIEDFRVMDDSAIKRANLKVMNHDSGARNYVIAKEMLKGVDGGKVALEERKEAGKRLDDKFRFAIDESYGWVRDSDLLKYKEYLWMILSTESGRKFSNIRDTGRISITLFNNAYQNSSYGHDRVQINIHPDQSKRYVKAFGHNKFVQLGGIRSLAHELTHGHYRDKGSKSMKEGEEIEAMKLANRIMREIYGLDAGERKSYALTPPNRLPDGAIILK